MRLLLSLILVALMSMPALAGPLEDIAALQKGKLKSVRSAFKQQKKTELLPRPVKSRGTFYFMEGAGVRWVYDGQMVAVYDGKRICLHYTEMDEAECIDGIVGFSGPLGFNVAELSRDYDIMAKATDNGNITLSLTPRQQMPFRYMRMYFHKGDAFPYEVSVHEETGDVTHIKFIEPDFNVELDNKLFRFTVPRGVKVKQRKFR